MGSVAQIVPARPETKELVTKQILTLTGLNAQAFSGAQNPSTVYRLMVDGSPSVYPYYREIEEKDLAIASALEARRILAMARDAKVQASDPENGQAQRYADGLSAFLGSIPNFRGVLRELLDAPAYGLKVMEILWRSNGAALSVEKIIGRPQELFRFGKLFEPQTGPLHLANFPGGEGQPVPENKFLVASYQTRDGDRRGRPVLRRLFWPSWFKRNALRLDLQFLEKPIGTVVVQYPPNASTEEQDLALKAARAIVDEVAAATPETFKVLESVLTTARSREGRDYQGLIDYFDAEMTRMILGQTLATRGAEQQRGTQALGKVHESLLFEYIRHDLLDLEDIMNEQLAAPWLLWTFGAQALDPAFRPRWTTDSDAPKDVNAALDQLAKARAMGAAVPALEVYERGQIRQPEGDEPVLPPPALSAAILPIEETE